MNNAMNPQTLNSALPASLSGDALSSDRLLVWQGDDIGLVPDGDVIVTLRDPAMPAGVWHVSLEVALEVFDRLDSFGRQRMESALRFSAEHDHLSPGDLAIWTEFLTHGTLRSK